MSRAALALALWCCATVAAMAGGRLEWVETRHSVGEVNESDGRVEHVFVAVNTGDDDVVINRVRASCGCSTADYPRRPIAPGDTARVAVTFNPAGWAGGFTMFYTVLTGSEPQRTTLRLEGTVKAEELTVNEKYPVAVGSLKLNASSVPFGEMTVGEVQEACIEAYNDSDVPMLFYAEDMPRGIEVTPRKAVVPPRGTVAVKVRLDTGKARWRGYAEGDFTMFAQPEEPGPGALAGIRNIDVMATVHDDFASWSDEQRCNAPSLALESDRLVFADIDTLAASCQLMIKNCGKSPLQIYGIRPAESCVTVDFDNGMSLDCGEKAAISVEVLPGKMEDKILNTYIIIYCNDPLHYKQAVRIVGNKK